MNILIGFVLVMGLVVGGYMLSGGKLDVVLQTLPYEMMMVGGAALGAFVISNSMGMMRETVKGFGRAFKGPRWSRQDYGDLLKLMYELTRLYRNRGILALEPHIERPESSDIFMRYPKILKSRPARELIVDSFRMISMQFDDAYQFEDALNRRLEVFAEENMHPTNGLNTVADGLPAIGIVAAVLGVIKTMASVDQPPEVLGVMIAGALVGTLLGVFLAYCLVTPIAGRLKQIEEQDLFFMYVIRDVVCAAVKGNPPNVAAEIGRANLPHDVQPSFEDTEQAQRSIV